MSNLKIRPQREVIHQLFMRYWYLHINQFSKSFPEEEFTKAEKSLHDPVTCGQVGHPRLWRRMYTVILEEGDSGQTRAHTSRGAVCAEIAQAAGRMDSSAGEGGFAVLLSLSVICEA